MSGALLDPASKSAPARSHVRSAIHLGCSFCGVFMAFSVSQNFQTSSDHKSAGSTALGILYGFFTFSNFFASFVVSSLGAKLCLFAGALAYVAFVAANIHYEMALLYSFSALLGLGAAIIWCAQGTYISNCASLHERAAGLPRGSTLGFFNGLFFSIFQGNQVVGNLLAALLFQKDVSTATIFVVMTTICGCGALTLLVLPDPAKELAHMRALDAGLATDASMSTPGSPSDSFSSAASTLSMNGAPPQPLLWRLLSVFGSLRMLLRPRMLILLPVMVYSGLSQTYLYGDFPPLIDDRSTKFYVLAVMGACDALSSYAMGKLSDKAGRVLPLSIGFATAGGSILFLANWTVDQSAEYVFFLVCIFLGVSDGVFNTQIYSILGSWFPGAEIEAAFANFKLFQAGSTAVAFLVSNKLGFTGKCIMTGAALIAGLVCLAAWDLAYRARGGKGSVFDSSPRAESAAIAADDLKSPMLSHSESDYGAGNDALALDVANKGGFVQPVDL